MTAITSINMILLLCISISQAQQLPEMSEIQENPIATLVSNEENKLNQELDLDFAISTPNNEEPQVSYDFDGKPISANIDSVENVETNVSDNLDWSIPAQEEVEQNNDGYYDLNGNFVSNQNTQTLIDSDSNLDNYDNVNSINTDQIEAQNDLDSSNPIELTDDQQEQQEEEQKSSDNHYESATFEMPIKPENQIYDDLGNQVDSTDGLNTYLALDSGEIDNKVSDNSVQEKLPDCIVIYSQCQFKGESMQICQSLKQIEDFSHQIMSIFIPKGYSMSVYNLENFQGEKTVYKESQECLAQPISFLQLMGRQTNQLRGNQNLRNL